MAVETKQTIDHDEIRDWAEVHGATPAVVSRTRDRGNAVLRFNMGVGDPELEDVSWEEFFMIFDGNGLAFVYEEEGEDGEDTGFYRFVLRDEVALDEEAQAIEDGFDTDR
jgi:hypothetical protein